MIQNIFSEELIQALGWTMIHSLWQGFAVAILMGITMLFLQKKSAKVRYELAWFSLFLVFVLSLSTFIYLFDAASGGEELGGALTVITESGIFVENSSTVQTFFQKTIAYFNEHLPLIVTLWVMGMIFFLLRLLGGLAYVEKLKSQKQHTLPENWQRTFQSLQAQFPMKKTIRMAESSLAKVPMVIGYLKPIILFPIGAANQLSQQEVEAVLAHELAHIYRNDYLLNIIQSLIETIFYYHPAVWWISANIRTERENCCDDIAVRLCGNSLTYVKALVSLEEIKPAPSLAMSFSSGSKNQLLNRVKRILNQPQNKFNIMEKFTATCFLLAVLLIFSVSATRSETPQKEQEPNVAGTAVSQPVTATQPIDPNREMFFGKTVPEVEQDTVPKKLDGNFYYSKDGEKVEVAYENGKMQELKINGEAIPEKEFSEYESYVNELMGNVPSAPEAPLPPDFAIAGEGEHIVKKSTDENGNTVYIVETNKDGETSTITISGENGEIIVDGKAITIGDAPFAIAHGSDVHFLGDSVHLDFPGVHLAPDAFAMAFGDEDFEFVMPEFPDVPALLEDIEFPEAPPWPEMNFDDLNFDFNFNFDTIPGSVIWIDGDRIDWDDLSEEEKAAHREKLEDARRQMEDARIAMREELAKIKEINREEYKEAMEQARKELAEVREKMKETQKEQRERMREQQEQLREELKEARERQREDMREARESYQEALAEVREARSAERSAWVTPIESQLKSDGHVKSDGSYKFSLTDNRLKINGKKQSQAEWQKYIDIYKSATNQSLGSDFKINISSKGGKNRSVSVSISDDSN